MDFPGRRCKKAFAYIDNVIFVGSREDVEHDAREVIRRCKLANVTLNEADVIERDGMSACIQQKGEWCGVYLDFVSKEVRLIDKTVLKIELSWSNRDNWTYRQFAAHIGLLFWSWGIIEIPVYNCYSLLKFISATSKKLQDDESLWDTPCSVFSSTLPALEAWTKLGLANKPRKIKPSSDPVWFLCTDASAWGWGYRAFTYLTGEIRSFGQAWTREQLTQVLAHGNMDAIKHSVYAEPLAIDYSLCHLLDKRSPAKIQLAQSSADLADHPLQVRMKIGVATDNSSAQHTMNRGFASRSFDINAAIAALRTAFPESDFDIDISFVPGHMNPADKPSRGKLEENDNINNSINNNSSASTGHNADHDNLRRLAGMAAKPSSYSVSLVQ